MSKKDGYVEITDLESFKRAFENAEIYYEELKSIDDDEVMLETKDNLFRFTIEEDLFSIESNDRLEQ